jgi:hypothetical protein
MYGLAVEIERCLDGVELVELPPPYSPDRTLAGGGSHPAAPKSETPLIFRHRTARTESTRLEFTNLESTAVIKFLNAGNDERLRSFLEQFGLTVPGSQVFRSDVLQSQAQFRHLLETTNIGSPIVALNTANKIIADYKGSELLPVWHLAGQHGAPHVILQGKSLLGYMLMEVANVAAYGARLAACEKCGAAFLTGKMTWRRAHSVYCSDRCRMAALRARKAQTKTGG